MKFKLKSEAALYKLGYDTATADAFKVIASLLEHNGISLDVKEYNKERALLVKERKIIE